MKVWPFILLAFLGTVEAAHSQTPPITQCVTTASAGGTADALTIPKLPCIPTTTLLVLTTTLTNTTSTPTLQFPGGAAAVIKNYNGNAVVPGIFFAGARFLLTYNGTNWFVLTNNIANITNIEQVSTVANMQTLASSVGDVASLVGYYASGDMPVDYYKLVSGACTLNSGAGDGFSQIPSTHSPDTCWMILPQSAYDVRQAGVIVGGTDPNGNNGTLLQDAITYVGLINGHLIISGTVGYSGALTTSMPLTISGPGELDALSSTGFSVGGTQFDATRTYWLNSGPVTVSNAVSEANTTWSGSLPVGMINLNGGSGGTSIYNLTIDCKLQANCSDIVESSQGNNLYDLTITGYKLFGIAGYRSMSGVRDLTIEESGSDVTNWTGVGLGCLYNGNTDDTRTENIEISGTGIGALVGCGDFKLLGSHIFPAPVGPSDWKAMVINNQGVAVVSNNTFDNSEVVWERASGQHLGELQFKNNVFEYGSGGTATGGLLLKCTDAGPCGDNTTQLSNIVLDGPIQNSAGGQTLFSDYPIVLEDQDDNLNPDAWYNQVQQLWGALRSGCTFACNNVPFQNGITQGAQFTFTGDLAAGSFQISNASILPVQGTTLTMSAGSCSLTSAQITDISYTEDKIWFAGTGTGSGCAGQTVTAGSLTATISAVNFTNNSLNLSDLPPFSLYEQIVDTTNPSCLPTDTWISGYNGHTGAVLYNNATPTATTCANTGDTFTVTPYQYYLAPSDAGALVIANPSVNTTINLRSDIPRGQFNWITPRNGASSVTLHLIDGGKINGGTSDVTLTDGTGSITELWAASTAPNQWWTK